jgi:hypothetical protein
MREPQRRTVADGWRGAPPLQRAITLWSRAVTGSALSVGLSSASRLRDRLVTDWLRLLRLGRCSDSPHSRQTADSHHQCSETAVNRAEPVHLHHCAFSRSNSRSVRSEHAARTAGPRCSESAVSVWLLSRRPTAASAQTAQAMRLKRRRDSAGAAAVAATTPTPAAAASGSPIQVAVRPAGPAPLPRSPLTPPGRPSFACSALLLLLLAMLALAPTTHAQPCSPPHSAQPAQRRTAESQRRDRRPRIPLTG